MRSDEGKQAQAEQRKQAQHFAEARGAEDAVGSRINGSILVRKSGAKIRIASA